MDGLGAVLSTLLLGGLLPAIQSHIGLPTVALRSLALCALCLALYSLRSVQTIDKIRPSWFLGIAAGNTGHLLLTAALIAIHWAMIRPLGCLYFVLEALIVLPLIAMQYQAYQNMRG